MQISIDRNTTIDKAKKNIFRYLRFINGKLRYNTLDSREYIIQAYAKSLMNYLAAPLVAANYINGKTVESWERLIYRKMFLVPFDVKGEAIVNLCCRSKPARDVVSQTALNI